LGRYADSIEPLMQAVTLEPGFARYHTRLALSYAEVKRTAEAVAECERALTMAPRDGVVLEGVARVLGATGQLARAEEIARDLVKLEPENAAAFGRLAWVLAERRTYEEAAAMARASIRLDPNNYAAWANLGYAAMERNDLAEAEEATRQALRLRPGLPSATTNLVAILRRRKANDEAARLLAESCARDPANKSFRDQLAEVRGLLAQESALRWSDRAVLTVLLVIVAVPVAMAFPGVALTIAAVAFALAWLLWKMK
jgi:superkiller protein 3